MAPLLHDPEVRASIRRRVESLQLDSPRQWGKMSIDQMLWHVNVSLSEAAGEYTPTGIKVPLPKPIMRFIILHAPWGRGARTRPDMLVVSEHDFNTQKERCLALIAKVTGKSLDDAWPVSASMGNMKGKHWSRLQARHLDHHLRQFGA
jgi:hypothetical protein